MNTLANYSKKVFVLSVLAILASLVVYTYYRSSAFYNDHARFVRLQAQESVQGLANQVQNYLDAKIQQLLIYANELEQRSFHYKDTVCLLKESLKKTRDISAFTILYLPEFSLQTNFTSFVVSSNQDTITPLQDDSRYIQADWYKTVLDQLMPAWSSVSKSEFTDTIVVHGAVPLFVFDKATQTKKLYALLVADIPVTIFSQFLQEIKEENSYGFIIDRHGTFIAYPLQEYVRAQKTLFDYARMPGQQQWYTLAQDMIQREKDVIELTDTQTRQKFTVAYAPIAATGWSLAVVYSQAFTDEQALQTYRLSLQVWLALAAFCFWLILTSVLYIWGITNTSLWLLVAFFSLICWVLIMHIWMVYAQRNTRSEEHQEILLGQEHLERFLRVNQRTRRIQTDEPTLLIPTGLWIAGMIVTEEGEVRARGILWQRYSSEVLKHVTPKVLISNAYEVTLTPAYTHTERQDKIVAWRFNVVIKEQFGYGKYPLDQHALLLKLVHPDFDKLIILTPDFQAWPNGQIQAIDLKNMQLGEWNYITSYFGYALTHYKPDLGITNFGAKVDFPQLYFNILIKRNYVYPLIAGLLPIMIVAIVFFALLLMVKLGDTFTRIISIISSVFFALVVAHQRLKAAAQIASEANYLEYFYFCMYVLILLVAIDMLLYFLGTNIKFIHPDNRPAKLIYWPLINFVFLVITILAFY